MTKRRTPTGRTPSEPAIQNVPCPLPTYGDGWHRMKSRLGQQRMEEIRQEVLRDQEAERARARGEEPPTKRDRRSYRDYPKPTK